uniref:L-galactose dehydrogenase-like n=1 Tax=Saccoglossus kowalevskii TaxID=10224 RepID=A0ABM0GX08_SACKO|nr:PREDICTED: L-galactose dehydrogenase-like [Saccoglossus kowalevskii]
MTGDRLPPTYVEGFHNRDDVMKMKYNRLGNTGLQVSVLGFGASSLGSVFHETDDDEAIQVVYKAIKSGINIIDVAPWYGHGKAETILGQALRDIPRQAYYLTTKVGRYQPKLDEMFDFTAERTMRSVNESLQRLGLNYVDIIQIHDMEFAPNLDVILNDTLWALQRVKDSGKAKFIGITGYPMDNFRIKMSNKNKLTTITGVTISQEKNVAVMNAAPISMGLLSNRGPPSWHPATDDIKDACKEAAKYCQDKGVDISKLAMHFTLDHDEIPTTFVSTASLSILESNLACVHEKLSTLETNTMADVMNRYFRPLGNKTWEGIEVANYWRQLETMKN